MAWLGACKRLPAPLIPAAPHQAACVGQARWPGKSCLTRAEANPACGDRLKRRWAGMMALRSVRHPARTQVAMPPLALMQKSRLGTKARGLVSGLLPRALASQRLDACQHALGQRRMQACFVDNDQPVARQCPRSTARANGEVGCHGQCSVAAGELVRVYPFSGLV